MNATTPASTAPKVAADDASPASDFSATLTKLFSPNHSDSNNSSRDATSTHEQRRSKYTEQDAASNNQKATDTAVSPYTPQTVSQLPELPQSGARSFGTLRNPGDSFYSSLVVTPQAPDEIGNVAAGSDAYGNAGTAPLQAGMGDGPSSYAIKAQGEEITGLPQSARPSNELLGPGFLNGTSVGLSGPSPDEINVDVSAQIPVTVAPVVATNVATNNEATLLAATQATASTISLPNTDGSSAASLEALGTHVPAGRPDQTATSTPAPQTTSTPASQTIPTPAPKALGKNDANTQPVSTTPPQVESATAFSENSAAMSAPQIHKMSVNPDLKASALKPGEKTAVLDRDASLQSSLDNGGASSITSVSNSSFTGTGNSSGQQDDSGSSNSDRRSKDDAVASIVSAAAPVAPIQSASPAVHLVAAPTSHPVQEQPIAASSPGFSSNTSTKLSDVEPSTATEVKTVVSTSKLLQTLNQSEMRVGMRSSEFGDISIRTSATHDNILTQISLQHAELAKSLANHIPDMQARLADHGNHEVRINSGDQNTGLSSATSDTSDARSGSHGGQQHHDSRPSFAPSYGGSNTFDSALPTAALANTLQNVWQNGRLDIQA